MVEAEMAANKASDDDSEQDSDVETRLMVRDQNRKKKKSGGFQAMGLSYPIFKGILHKGYKIPTPIQRKTIPLILEGQDIVAMARTGSGKTAAFLVPMFEKLKSHTGQSGARALIMSPTRELALQTLRFTKDLGKYTGLKAAVILGGDSMDDQFEALHSSPDIIIATPGRFMHVAVEMDLKLSSVEYVVFDEADRLFEMGFETQLREIIHRLADKRQTVLFSATLPKGLIEFAKAGLHNPNLIRLDVDSKLSPNLQTQFFQCRSVDKNALLLHLLTHVIKKEEQTVVFLATKHHVEFVNLLLTKAGISCCCVYSTLDPAARKINVAKFTHKKCTVMLVTDLAARGIDIPILDNVINYHFPAKGKLFVHRVGRVARAGRTGTAYSLVAADEMPYLLDLHLFLGKPVKWVTDKNKNVVSDGMAGNVPQALLDSVDADIRLYSDNSHDWKNLEKVCYNGYKLYLKSRPAASSESIKRMKELECVSLNFHPLLVPEDTSEKMRVDLLTSMRSFRPKTTIFEVGGKAKSPAFSVMQTKRKKHSNVIAVSAERRSEIMSDFINQADKSNIETSTSEIGDSDLLANSITTSSKKNRKRKQESVVDEENYISYRPSDYNSERGLGLSKNFSEQAKGAVLDLTGDDNEEMKRSQNQMRWDRKKKKFVGQAGNQGKNKRIKTESGQWISASYKSDAYQQWLHKSKMKEQEEFGSEDEEAKPKKINNNKNNNRLQVVGYTPFRRRTLTNKDTKDKRKFKREIRTKDEIVKNRKVKEKHSFNQKRRELARRGQKSGGSKQGGRPGRGRR